MLFVWVLYALTGTVSAVRSRELHMECHFDGVHMGCHFDGVHMERHFDGVHMECYFDGVHKECHFDGVHMKCHFDGRHMECSFDGVHMECPVDDINCAVGDVIGIYICIFPPLFCTVGLEASNGLMSVAVVLMMLSRLLTFPGEHVTQIIRVYLFLLKLMSRKSKVLQKYSKALYFCTQVVETLKRLNFWCLTHNS